MVFWLIKRIISLVPIASLLIACTFLLSRSMPGDALDMMVQGREHLSTSSQDYQYRKEKLAERLGLNKPLFYFSITTLAEANAYRYFTDGKERIAFNYLLNRYGNYKTVFEYANSISYAEQFIAGMKEQYPNIKELDEVQTHLRYLKTETNTSLIQTHLHNIQQSSLNIKAVVLWTDFVREKFDFMVHYKMKWKQFVPVINIYADNQFHSWFLGNADNEGVLTGNLGLSYFTGKPVVNILKERTGWSLLLSVLSVVLAYCISIPLAAWLTVKKSKKLNVFFDLLVSVLYATPVYLLGVVLLFLFSNPDFFNILPSSGIMPLGGYLTGTSVGEKLWTTCLHLIMPLTCYTYATFAFVLRASKQLLNEEMKTAYIKTAYAKGLKKKDVVFKHALKNAVLPLAAVFTNVFPAILGGSVIIETLFSIPGIGLEIFNAAVSRNYPVIAAVFMFTGILTLISFLLSDFITSRLDPRISFHQK